MNGVVKQPQCDDGWDANSGVLNDQFMEFTLQMLLI